MQYGVVYTNTKTIRFRCSLLLCMFLGANFPIFLNSRDGQKKSKLGMGIGYWVF
jgi:hypothetical protein